MATKKRNRAISLSLDWDNIVKEEEGDKGAKAHLAGNIAYDKDTVDFCTGSSYTGKWNALGMAVYGTYLYPLGCEYEGAFEDGMFHGEGTLTYPMGQKLEGYWEKGKMIAYKFTNVDGLDYADNWSYCVMPDRRFHVSIREGLQPAGREFLTNQQPDRPNEPDCYDTGDGFYNPTSRCIIMARDPEDAENLDDRDSEAASMKADDDFWVNAVTMVTNARHEWIVKNCRKAWDENAGYRPEFYEDWISGRRSELEELDKKYILVHSSEHDTENSDDKLILNDNNSIPEIKESVDYACTGRKLAPSTSKADVT